MIFNWFISRWACEYFHLALQKIESGQLKEFNTSKTKCLSEENIGLFLQHFQKGHYLKMCNGLSNRKKLCYGMAI